MVIVEERILNMDVKNTPTLETQRLIVRKFTNNDIEALHKILCDKEINTYLPWYPMTSLQETKQFYEQRYEDVYHQSRGYSYAICLKNDNIPIGYVKVDMNDSHDLGYGLCKEYWHKGIVTEACRAVIKQVKEDGIPYITATHDRKNPRSGGVMIQLGMNYQYSYEEQWQPKDIRVIFRMYQLNLDGDSKRVYKAYWENSKVHYVEVLS